MIRRLNQQTSAIIELTIAGALWGFGFIAAIWALRGMGPLSITGWRFALAAVFGLGISFFIPSLRSSLTDWKQFKLAFIPGLLISATLCLQTWGLQYTTATKSAFITTLYVLMVPLLERFLLKRRLPRFHLVYVAIALIGVALICDLQSIWLESPNLDHLNAKDLAKNRLNVGDLVTFFCAIAATLHILWFGVIAKKIGSSFTFNNFQSVWAGFLPLTFSILLEPTPRPSFADFSMIGLLALAFGSTLIAFSLQVRAQKHISPSLVSLLFLLESPFSALFAIAFLGEGLRAIQWAGAGLILSAAAMSSIFTTEAKD
jgi:drug/metabolite transporter (DMT)-like permease